MGLNLKSTSSKVLASAALLAAAAGVAGLGTYGAFTSATDASATVAAGTVKLETVGGDTNFTASGFVPGDSMQRAVTIKNTGDQDLSAILLSTAPSSPIASRTALTGSAGLKVAVDSCPTEWLQVDRVGLACPAGATSLTSNVAATATNVALTSVTKTLPSLEVGHSSYLRVTLTLPATVTDNTMQGKTDSLRVSFIGATRAGTLK